MSYLIEFKINTKYIYFINAIQNVLKKKITEENNFIKYISNENKIYYYYMNYDNYNLLFKNIEELIKKYEKNIKNTYPEFLDDWNISFHILKF
jgi:hypothetical protein